MGRYQKCLLSFGPKVVGGLLTDKSSETLFRISRYASAEHVEAIEKARNIFKELQENNEKVTDLDLIEPIFKLFSELTDPNADDNRSQFKFLEWICKVYLEACEQGEKVKAEDLYKIKEDLQDFKAFSTLLIKKDIHEYSSLRQLLKALKDHQHKRDKKKANEQNRRMPAEVKARIENRTTVIYEGKEGKILMPHSQESSQYWGQQTRWCISSTGSFNHFSSYYKDNPILIYLPKVSLDERIEFRDYSSFKYAGVNGNLYDELDRDPSYLPLHMKRLIDAAMKVMDSKSKKYFTQHGGFSRYGLSPPEAEEEQDEEAYELKRKISNVCYKPTMLRLYPEIAGNKEALISIAEDTGANGASFIRYIDEGLKSDAAYILKLLKLNPNIYRWIDKSLKKDLDFVSKAMKANPNLYQYIYKNFKLKDEFAIAAIKKNYRNFKEVPDKLKADPDIAMLAFDYAKKDKKSRFTTSIIAKALSQKLAIDNKFLTEIFNKQPEALIDATPSFLAALPQEFFDELASTYVKTKPLELSSYYDLKNQLPPLAVQLEAIKSLKLIVKGDANISEPISLHNFPALWGELRELSLKQAHTIISKRIKEEQGITPKTIQQPNVK